MKATKVLIVDDEPDVLESTALLVESLGYETIRLSTAADILETCERERPGLLLQDLKMPGLNVSGLVASLRSNPGTADIAIVFFSANDDLPGQAARYDAWGYLSKPFGKQELAHLLDQAMGAERVKPRSSRELNREVRSIFHDYWNLLAALNNYLVILDDLESLPPVARKSIDGLDDLVLQLEAKTDRLQQYLMGLLATMDASLPSGGRSSSEPIPGS